MTDPDLTPEALDALRAEVMTLEAHGFVWFTAEDYAALRARLAEVEAELHTMKTAGIAEIAARNPSVMEYMQHWEGRAARRRQQAQLATAHADLKKQILKVREREYEAAYGTFDRGFNAACDRILALIDQPARQDDHASRRRKHMAHMDDKRASLEWAADEAEKTPQHKPDHWSAAEWNAYLDGAGDAARRIRAGIAKVQEDGE